MSGIQESEAPARLARAEFVGRNEECGIAIANFRPLPEIAGMKRGLALLVGAACAVVAVAAEPFSRRITPAEADQAGLGKLTPAERAQLDALIDRVYGAVPPSSPAPVYTATNSLISVRTAEPAPSSRVVVAPGTKVEYSAMESRIVGDFSGWEARTIFTLENGDRWQVANADRYFVRAIANPKVTITPSGIGGFWLQVEGADQRVRVRKVGGGK